VQCFIIVQQVNTCIHPIHFRPWIVSKYEPRPQIVSKRAKAKSARMDMAMMAEKRVSAPVVSYEDAREYKIEKLVLPSTGVPLDVKVLTWSSTFL
jgi:hypothetical protein